MEKNTVFNQYEHWGTCPTCQSKLYYRKRGMVRKLGVANFICDNEKEKHKFEIGTRSKEYWEKWLSSIKANEID